MTFKQFIESNIDLFDAEDYQELFYKAGQLGYALRLRELLDASEIDYIYKLRYIPSHGFGYSDIHYINLPKNIVAIEEHAFAQSNIEMVQAAYSSVSHIRSRAFAYCEKLEQIWLPKTLRFIGSLAFKGCSNLKKIIYEGTLRDWDINVIKDAEWKDDNVQITVQCLDGEVIV